MNKTLAIIIIALAIPAMAQDTVSGADPEHQRNEATQKLHESLDQPKPTEDGAKQAPGGEAGPDENWFGCKPDEQEQRDSCDDRSDDRSEGDGA